MILVIDTDPAIYARIADRLEPQAIMPLATDVATGRAMIVANPGLDIVFIGPNVAKEDVLGSAGWIRDERPEISVVAIAENLTSEMLQRLLRAGVRDVLHSTFSPKQLAASLQHAAAAAERERERFGVQRSASSGRGKIVTVLSAKGGVGKSFIASNLAVMLATPSEPVALVDLDLEFGDLGVFFQIQPKHTIGDAASLDGALDDVALEGMLTRHRSGVRLLAAPQEPGNSDMIAGEDIQNILGILAARYRYVIVDTPASFTDHVLAAIDSSDVLPTVTGMDVASIRSAGLCLRTLEMLGVPAEKVHLVLNRADSRVGLNLAEVERGLGNKVAVSIPSSREVPLSVNRGEPLALADPRSAVTRSIGRLVALLRDGGPKPGATNGHRTLLGRTR